MKKKLKMGMVGGGIGSFIGAIHRNAAFLDNQIELICGSFSSNYENSIDTGKDLFLDAKRIYKNYQDISIFRCTFIYVKMGGFQTCVIVYANPAADIET